MIDNNQHFDTIGEFSDYLTKITYPIFNIICVKIRSMSLITKFNKFKDFISKMPKIPSIIAV